MSKTRVCHARKGKRKQLRKEASRKRIWIDSNRKLIDANRADEVSHKAMVAIMIFDRRIEFDALRRASRMDKDLFNQRQKRKRWRNSPYLRKKAA